MYNDKYYNEVRIKIIKSVMIVVLLSVILYVLLSLLTGKKIFNPPEYNEKATIEYLKEYAKGNITKIVILTDGKYSKFESVCLFTITDKAIINEFKMIIQRQGAIVKKKAMGQLGRSTQITLYRGKEMYSFCADGEPYSGKRPINECELSFYKQPDFDVSESFVKDPLDSLSENAFAHGPMSPDLQNYEFYYFLKKYVNESVEKDLPDTRGVSKKCYVTYVYK